MSELQYPDAALEHLAAMGPEMSRAVAVIGRVSREAGGDPFKKLMKSIVGQQISTKAQEAVWARLAAVVPVMTPDAVASRSVEELRSAGISEKKAGWMRSIAQAVSSGELDLTALDALPDEQAIAQLTAMPGVGRWTAEMLLLFAYARTDVLSLGDFGVRRGLGMIYGRELTMKELREIKRRSAPWGSVAALLAWAAASGAYPEFQDPVQSTARMPTKRAKASRMSSETSTRRRSKSSR